MILALPDMSRSTPPLSGVLEKWKKYVPFIPLIPFLPAIPCKCINAKSPSRKPFWAGQFGNLLKPPSLMTQKIPPCHK